MLTIFEVVVVFIVIVIVGWFRDFFIKKKFINDKDQKK